MRRTTLATLLLLAACSSGGSGEQEPVTEFLLADVNPTSATFNVMVTPRRYLGQVSAYYFGSAL